MLKDTTPSNLSFLSKVAAALGAQVKVRLSSVDETVSAQA